MANLAFDTNSLHYRYYMFIRWMWGYTESHPRTSLCAYCQTMLWGSIFIVVLSWALVLGWLSMKLGRVFYKLQNPFTDVVINFLESRTDWITRLDSGPKSFADSPMGTALCFCMMGVFSIFMALAAVALVVGVLGGTGFIVWNIVGIGTFVLYAAARVFALLFVILHCFGGAFYCVYNGAAWLFTNGSLWYTVASWVIWAIAVILGIGVISVALCFMAFGVSKLPFAKKIGQYLTNKFNGFNEAKKERQARAKEELKKLPPWECKYCHYDSNPAENIICKVCEEERSKSESPTSIWLYPFVPFILMLYPVVWIVEKCSGVKKKIEIIGPLGILWSYIVAMKKGVCPIVEFVDPAQLQAEAQASAKERMEREAAP